MRTTQRAIFLLLAVILLLFTTGCGSGRDSISNLSSAPTQATPPAQTGSLRFSFIRPQATSVPSQSHRLKFEFLDHRATVLLEVTKDYADSLLIESVPIETTQVWITTIDLNGYPLTTISSPVRVTGGQTVDASLTGATSQAVTFDELQPPGAQTDLTIFETFRSSQRIFATSDPAAVFSDGTRVELTLADLTSSVRDTTVARVAPLPQGPELPEAVGVGSTFWDLSFDINGVTRSVAVPIRVARFSANPSSTEMFTGETRTFRFNFTRPDGSLVTDVANTDPNNTILGLTPFQDESLDGISLISNPSGTVQVGPSVPDGRKFTLQVAYSDPVSGFVVSGEALVTVVFNPF